VATTKFCDLQLGRIFFETHKGKGKGKGKGKRKGKGKAVPLEA
jgi:hypothetical protein